MPYVLNLMDPPSPLTRIPSPFSHRPSSARARASATGALSPIRGHLLLPRLLARAPAGLPSACCMLAWVTQQLSPALRPSAERPSVLPLPLPRKDESFHRVSSMPGERGSLGSTTLGGGEKSSDRVGLAHGCARPYASSENPTTRRPDCRKPTRHRRTCERSRSARLPQVCWESLP